MTLPAPATPAPPSAPPPQLQPVPLRFHGSASEYFRIWIVNVLLSVLTLGVYSAWAKVRRLRYFYRNTELRGECFDYHAAPLKILFGRAIALVLLVLYASADNISPLYGGSVAFLLLLAIFPWLLVRSRMFHARNTSYRNLRFGFAPAYASAYRLFAGYGTLAALSLGLAYPLFAFKRHELLVQNLRFGRTHFRLRGELRDYNTLHYQFAALFGALFLFWLMVMFFSAGLGTGSFGWLLLALCVFSYCFAFAFLQAGAANQIISATEIASHKLRSVLQARELATLYFGNLLAITLSLGLAIPWAQIRSHRYRVTHTALLARDGLDEFIAAEHEDPEAFGEEIGEFFDFDFGF